MVRNKSFFKCSSILISARRTTHDTIVVIIQFVQDGHTMKNSIGGFS
jgi:hypothetical protein